MSQATRNITRAEGMDVAGVHTDQLLSNLARQYRPDRKGLIADLVCPRLPVAHESDLYPVFRPRDFFATDVDTLVADRSPAREIQIGYDKETYQTEEHALKISTSRRERNNADSQVRLEQSKLYALSDQLALQREKRVAQLLRKTTNGGQLVLGATPAKKWDAEGATIELNLKTAKLEVRNHIGLRANTVVIPYEVAEVVALDPKVREILIAAMTGTGSPKILEVGDLILPSRLWGMNVIIPDAREIVTPEGQTDTYDDIWSDSVRVLYVQPGPDINVPSVAYSFVSEPFRVDKWTVDDPPGLEYTRNGEILDEKVVAPEAAYEINDVLT
jgi:hypothetical protein